MYKKFLQLTKNLTVSLEKGVNFLTTQEHNPCTSTGPCRSTPSGS